MKKNVFIKKENQKISLDFLSLDSYNDFDSIIKFLQKYYGAKITKSLDGPDMRVTNLQLSNIDFELYNDPYGNALSTTKSGENIIEMIAKDIDSRLQ